MKMYNTYHYGTTLQTECVNEKSLRKLTSHSSDNAQIHKMHTQVNLFLEYEKLTSDLNKYI